MIFNFSDKLIYANDIGNVAKLLKSNHCPIFFIKNPVLVMKILERIIILFLYFFNKFYQIIDFIFSLLSFNKDATGRLSQK